VTALSSFLVALTLNVPFLPQTPALCGGAAVAMVFRYYGDRHADVQQFEPLVDRRAGGIADDVLIEAVRQRRWRAVPLQGSIDVLRDHLAAGEPLVLLLEDRPGRYHYVVAVGADGEGVVVHDPTWGPWRRLDLSDFTRRWAAARFWTLLIQPDSADPKRRRVAAQPEPIVPAEKSRCERLLDQAVDEIGRSGLPSADETLGRVMRECPQSAAPVAELAAIRFAQERWDDAEALAERAVSIDDSNTYAWDVLGSARFIRDDAAGALSAWNRTGKPTLDSVVIDGLSRTRYSLVARFAGLTPNTTLTARDYRLAERRLRELPDQLAVRVGYTPEADGFATVRVAVAERAARPYWLTVGARAAIGREVRATLPGWAGQGEVWTASWRWWSNRPRVGLDFTAPRVGFLRGVSKASGSWERETYAVDDVQPVETRLHGGFATADWLAPDLRYELSFGVDSWNGSRRTASFGAGLERRLLNDRLALAAGGQYFAPLSAGPGFSAGSLAAGYRTSRRDSGLVHTIDAGLDVGSTDAPPALWSGAGEGMARPHLLRAHPLLVGDVLSGPVFGRRVMHLTAESRRWFSAPALIRLGIAGFADVASASRRLQGDEAMTHVDAGIGIRLRLPGAGNGLVRADYARGLRDGRQTVSVGIIADRF
jgi:Peptidase_C39 like family